MKIEFDPAKSTENDRLRGLPFDLVVGLDWSAAAVVTDDRKDYGEERFIGLVPDAGGRLFVVCFTVRGEALRVISFRKANNRERAAWLKR